MRKIFVQKVQTPTMTLLNDDHAHVSVVLRAKIGDILTVCDGDGYDYIYEITNIKRSETTLSLKEKVLCEQEPSVEVILFAALLKADKFEWAVQKCTELGVKEIYPFVSKFVQVKKESVKTDRLNKICKEAAQQCGRGAVPVVHEPISFDEALTLASECDSALFCYEKGETRISEISGNKIAIIIGSEGGFSGDEADAFINKGIVPVTLGKRILRAETACVAATALTMYLKGEI